MSLDFNFKANDLVKIGRTTWDLIKEIQKWISTTTFPQIPEEFIVLFLTACNNDVKFTQYTIECHFKYKKVAPEIFNDRDVDSPALTMMLSTMACIAIPKLNKKGHGIAFFRLNDNSFFKYDLISQCKISTMIVDLELYENPPIAYEVVVDIKKFSFKLLAKMNIITLRKLFNYVQEGLPIHFTALHVLNCGPVFEKLMSIFQVCMKKELINLIKIYPQNITEEELTKHGLSMDCMPSDYGGSLQSVDELSEQTIQKLRELRPFFQDEENLRKKHNY